MEKQPYDAPPAVPHLRRTAAASRITPGYISAVVDDFYDRIRKDDMLGPVFESRVTDWPEHLARMKQFWSSVLLNSGDYSGNVMQKHLAIDSISDAHFNRWLALFDQTLRQLEEHPDATEYAGGKARMIAASLRTAVKARDAVTAAEQESGLPPLQDGFQLPRWIWKVMIGGYAAFLAAVTAAVGRDADALFVIAIAALFGLAYFGLGICINGIRGRERPSPLDRAGGMLDTFCGKMDVKTVAGQILALPVFIALFALAAMVICRWAAVP